MLTYAQRQQAFQYEKMADKILKSGRVQSPPVKVGFTVVTEKWIRSFRTQHGGWTAKQLACLGVKWPPVTGWIQRAIGQEISKKDRKNFESFSTQGQLTFAEPPYAHKINPNLELPTTLTTSKINTCNCNVPPWEDCVHTLKTPPF